MSEEMIEPGCVPDWVINEWLDSLTEEELKIWCDDD